MDNVRFFEETLLGTKRAGIDKLIEHIRKKTDFYKAPASTRFHGAYEGGLLQHSVNVYHHLNMLAELYSANFLLRDGIYNGSVAICSLLHDICKADFYGTEYRNKKNEQGVWERVPVYVVQDGFPVGHGEKSVILLQRFIELRDDEILAIRWHMGGFDDAARGGFGSSNALSAAMEKSNLAVLLHMADLAATYFEEERNMRTDNGKQY